MFKLSVITDEVSQDFQEAVDYALKYKLSAVEIRSVYEKGPFELDAEDIKKMKDILSKTDLKVCSISAPFFKCSIDSEEEIAQSMAGLKNCIILAKELGAKIIRGFTFWSTGNFEERLDEIASKFVEPIKLLEEAGLTLAIEFDPTVFASNASMVKAVLDKIDSPTVKALWDPGNDLFAPNPETPYPNAYQVIKPYICHMHLKDAKIVDGVAQSTPMIEGEVDYRGQFLRLVEDNYDGYISLETHYRKKHEISDDLLQLPKGSSFSYLGYEASCESMENIQALLDELKISY